LFSKALEAEERTLIRLEFKENEIFRSVKIVPPQDIPGPLKGIIKGQISYIEEGTYLKNKGEYTYQILTEKLGDRIQVKGVIKTEPYSSNQILRIARINVKAKIFPLSSLIENFIIKSTKKMYDRSAEFINQWIQSHKL
jgi:hypothetical protein